eukprot:2963341-Alexandrium_andersonii.AAC.1
MDGLMDAAMQRIHAPTREEQGEGGAPPCHLRQEGSSRARAQSLQALPRHPSTGNSIRCCRVRVGLQE